MICLPKQEIAMPKLQKGFTMIELIMVIVILGILAAVALPRFYDLQSDARVAKMQAAVGAMKSGSAIAHGAALVSNKSAATGESVSMEGESVVLAYGYPDVAGIIVAAGGLGDYDTTTTAATGTVLTVQVDATHASCKAVFTEASSASTPPTIVLTTSGC